MWDGRSFASLARTAAYEHKLEIRTIEIRLTWWQRWLVRLMPRPVGTWYMLHGKRQAMITWSDYVDSECDKEEARDPFGDDITPVRPPPMFLRK